MAKGQDTRHNPNRKVSRAGIADLARGLSVAFTPVPADDRDDSELSNYDREMRAYQAYVNQHGGGTPPWEEGETEAPAGVPRRPTR